MFNLVGRLSVYFFRADCIKHTLTSTRRDVLTKQLCLVRTICLLRSAICFVYVNCESTTRQLNGPNWWSCSAVAVFQTKLKLCPRVFPTKNKKTAHWAKPKSDVTIP
jgi:hypothetical protein